MWYSYITTLVIWIYYEKHVVFADISNPETSISKIIDLIRPIDEWAEVAFSARQNVENERYITHKKLLHKFNFIIRHAYTNIKWFIRVFLLLQSEFTVRKRWYLQIVLIPIEVYPKFFLKKSCWRMSWNRIFS